jgi:trimethylamine--corrinoid protein Co-methyltransferase
MMVISDEIIGFVRRLMDGIQITPETLALEVIDKVGPGGSYVSMQHTMQHYREVWYPRVLDRQNHHGWMQAGQPTAINNARDLARDAISNHRPVPLAKETLEKLNAIVVEADLRAGV